MWSVIILDGLQHHLKQVSMEVGGLRTPGVTARTVHRRQRIIAPLLKQVLLGDLP